MTALWLAALLAVAAQASGGYRVAGEVLNSASGQPVPGARVTLVPADRGGPGASAVTGDDGRFSFTGLPEGKYDLSGQRRGLLPSHRMGAIVTGPGQDTSSIVLRLPPPAVISGKVVDDAGDPVADAQVELLGSRIVEGRRRMIQESIGRTTTWAPTASPRSPRVAITSSFQAFRGTPNSIRHWETRRPAR